VYPHRIRLRTPWECEPLAWLPSQSEAALPPSGRTAMPGRWANQGLAGFAGRVRHRRHFGSPANLDADERVWLTFGGIADQADVVLNETCLGRNVRSNAEFDVTALLMPRNVLTVDVECSTDEGGVWGEVALEVRRKAYMRWIRTDGLIYGDDGVLTIEGEVVGEAPGVLELYVVLGRGSVAYSRVSPCVEGQPFRLVTEALDALRRRAGAEEGSTATVQVDLVNGGEVWYTWRAPSTWRQAPGPGTGRD
jgi:hypothetical protein